MPESTAAASFFDEFRESFPPEELLLGLFDASLTGIALYTPVRAASGEIVDFAINFFNPAAQRMLQHPARPAGTYLQLFPHTLKTGVFAFHCDAFESGEPARMDVNYQGDGLDNYFQLSARRVGQGLVVSFSDTVGHSRTAVEEALRASQARERAALAEAEAQRASLHETFMQAPAMICIFAGPEHVFELVNPLYQRLVGERPLLGKPIRVAMPELHGQPIFGLLDEVYRTGEPFRANEMLVQLDHENSGVQDLQKRYYNFIYQPRRNAQGAIDGIMVFAYEVTEQVLAQQQVALSQKLTAFANEELAAANEELQTANEEIRATNDSLFLAQMSLHELNQELEARVADRTGQLQLARFETERQRARLERFFMQAPAGICILDGEDLVYELVNPAYQAFFPDRRLLGRPILEALPEIAGHAVHQTLRKVYETGITHEEPGLLISLEGPGGEMENRYFNYIQQARFDEKGAIDGIMVFAFEVTEQMLARQQADALQAKALEVAEALVRQREGLFQVFQETPACVALLRGPDYVFEYINPSYQALFPGRMLANRPLGEALPEVQNSGFIPLLEGVYRTGEPFLGTELPLEVRDEQGQPVLNYYTFTYQAYREAGQIVGVSILAFEVTAQVHARQKAAELQAEVTRRDAQLQVLFEQAPVATAVLRGPEFVVELANPGMCALWGHTREHVLGKPMFVCMPELRDQGFDRLLESVMATGIAYAAQEQPVQLLRHGELCERYMNFVYQPLRDSDGHIAGVAVVATDVTEQMAAGHLLAVANDELTAANQELATINQQLTRTNQDLDNFVYAASHDLKQPVNNLNGLFGELRNCTVFTDADEEDLLVPLIDEALHQLSTTIDDLAAVGQAQRLPNLPPETVDLAELTQEVVQTLQPQVLAARARITTDFAARPSITYARANLRTILLNLLSNSLKYTDPSRSCRIHLSLWLEDGQPVLLVEDNGLGFDLQRHRDELFHLFRRFHDHTEGTGVGLYLVNRIVQSHGGRVEVESEVGVGSTFKLYL